MSDPAQAWFLIGPTASGKNSAGVVLAEHLGAEVISLDSMKEIGRAHV